MKSYCSFWPCVPLFLAAISIFPLMAGAQSLPLTIVPTLPNINTNNIITITNSPYNAVGDGVATNTTAIQNAINDANTGGNVGGLLGGTVRIPGPGTFLTGPLTFKNNVNIQVDSGATLKMLPIHAWTNLTAQAGNGLIYGDLLYASGVTNLEISGSGTIDGQGLAWWTDTGTPNDNRPYMIYFNGNCKRVLVQDVTVQNSPKMHFVFKGSGDNNITFQNMTINTTDSRANQCDGIDLVGTNCLIQNCIINAGDDNIALGTSSAGVISAGILVTNCAFGTGHGMSIGSNTAGSVSNLTVINCTFNGTQYGIRMKSDNATSSGGDGGIAQNLSYLNLRMTNITVGAIVIYSYYNEVGTPTSITPATASAQTVSSATVPVWRNIVISNVTANVTGSGVSGIIWARMEAPATNIILSHVNITASKSFDIYNVAGIQFVDSQITVPSSKTSCLLFNAQLIVSNSVPTNTLFTFDGLTANVPGSKLTGSTLTFYNAQASLQNTNLFDDGPLTIGASTLIVSNNLTLFPTTVLNYTLGTNTTTVAVVGNLALGGTNNITAGSGFGGGTYTLMTYTGNLSGNKPVLAATPAGFTYALDTNTVGQVNLVVTPFPPGIPTNLTALGTNLLITLKWSAPSNAASYNLKRSQTNGGPYSLLANVAVTNYSDPAVNPGTTYYYVVSATNAAAESANSLQAGAIPLPSLVSTNLNLQADGNQLQLSWPQDHLGWRLQIQTNDPSSGLGANWVDWPGATNVIQTNIVIDPANGPVFLRLIYP